MDYRLPFDVSLLPHFQDWKAGVHTREGEPVQDVRLWTYLYSEASADLAVAFAKLFWPDFLEVEDHVLLAERYYPENFARWQDWRRRTGAERWRVEAVLNEVHLYDLLLEEAALPLLEYLAATLKRCWQAALREAFPGRRFIILYETEPEAYGPTLSFWQEAAPDREDSA